MARWLVDGMNVIGSRPDGWWRDRKKAMLRLVEELETWAAAEGVPVTAVLDGDPFDDLAGRDGLVEVVFAGRGRTADDEIVRRVAADPDPGSLTVVTSDGPLARSVESHGARLQGAGAFRRRL